MHRENDFKSGDATVDNESSEADKLFDYVAPEVAVHPLRLITQQGSGAGDSGDAGTSGPGPG